jgi:hypothetical protein
MLVRSVSIIRTIGVFCLVALGILSLLIGLVKADELARFDALANSAMVENRPTP